MGKIADLSNRINRAKEKYLPEYVINSGENGVTIYTVDKTTKIFLEYTIPETGEKVKAKIAEKEGTKTDISYQELKSTIVAYIAKQQEGKMSYRTRCKEYHKIVDFLKSKGYEINLRGNAVFRFRGDEPLNLEKTDLVSGEDVIDFLLAKEQIKVDNIKDIMKQEYEYEISEWEGLEDIINTLKPVMKICIMNKDMYAVLGKLTDGYFTELVTEKQKEGQKQYTDQEIKTIMQYFKNRKYFLQELGEKKYKSEKLDRYRDSRIEIGGDAFDFVKLINAEKLSKEQLKENPAYAVLNRKDDEEIYNMAIQIIRKEQDLLQEKGKVEAKQLEEAKVGKESESEEKQL